MSAGVLPTGDPRERDFYGGRAAEMVADRACWQEILHPPKARHLYPYLPMRRGARILDLGSGTSVSVARWLRRRAAEGVVYVGIDFLEPLLLAARASLPAGRFVVGGAADPPVRGPFDAILSLGTLHNLPDPDAALRRWAGLLAPGGVLCFYEPGPEAFPLPHRHPHERGVDPTWLDGALRALGLEPVHIARCNPPALGAVCAVVNRLHLTRVWRLSPLPWFATVVFGLLDRAAGRLAHFVRGRDLLLVYRKADVGY